MKSLKHIAWFLWRIWFYILVLVPILLLFPLLFATIISEKTYPQFFVLARIWAKFILFGMGFYYTIDSEANLEKNKSYMLVANHTSMTDIMLMLAVIPNNPFVFVGKKELVKIPVFGFFFKRTCIMVDRSDSKSRYRVFELAQKRLQSGLSICIFPEGGVPEENVMLDSFKDGAFRLAIEHQIPIVALTFADNKKRFPFTFFRGNPGKMRVKIHPIIPTTGLVSEDKAQLREQVRNIIWKQLEVFEKK